MSHEIRHGDALELLRAMPDASVQACVTSPPYYGLRSYLPAGHPLKPLELGQERLHDCLGWARGESCGACYVCKLRAVFAEVRRVLRSDGVLMLNLGDSYANDAKWGGTTGGKAASGLHGETSIGRVRRLTGLKPKDRIGIPERMALALQADGWWWRSRITWHKPNAMPSSVTDRPTDDAEAVLMFTKSERYFWDQEALREPHTMRPQARPNGHKRRQPGPTMPEHTWSGTARDEAGVDGNPNGRNARTVWTIPTQPCTDIEHYAVMPDELARRCIVATTRPGDVVLDPFSGAGTTGRQAAALGRRYIGIELSPEFASASRVRIAGPLFAGPSDEATA